MVSVRSFVLAPKHRRLGKLLLVLGLLGASLPLTWAADKAAKGHNKIEISADNQEYQPFKGVTQITGNVVVTMDNAKVVGKEAEVTMDKKSGKADSAVFKDRSKVVRKEGNSDQTIEADKLSMGLQNDNVQAQGKVSTQIQSGTDKKNNVFIQSDGQDFDQDKHVMKAIGHVLVKKDDMTAESPEALVLMSDQGGAEKIIFTHGVHLTQGDQDIAAETIMVKVDSGDLYCEKNVKSSMNGKDAQGKTTRVHVTSELQSVDKATGTMFTNGNVILHYDDYIAKGPKATFYRVNNELDHIILTGGSQIEDNERKVNGDTVYITVSPRKFNVTGNVTTFIKAKSQNNNDDQTETPAQKTKTSQPASRSKQKTTVMKPVKTNATQPNTSKTSSASSRPSASNTESPGTSQLDQELLIEKATQSPSSGK